jgi:AraC-like DNA-binding protein
VTIIGERTSHRLVRAPLDTSRVWTEATPLCPALGRHHILHAGIVEAFSPYRLLRQNAAVLEMLACFGGEGRVLIAGKWTRFGPNTAVLLPRNAAAGYYAANAAAWKFVRVCYSWPQEQPPWTAPDAPVMADFDPLPLVHAVEGLRQESLGTRDTTCMEHWVSLVHRLVLRFAQPWQGEDRLQSLWDKVGASLDEEWTLDRLAAEAGCGAEALRRRSQQQIGRSPMQHLTYLRLQRAAELLLTTRHKVEYIASAVGYGDAFAFSAMFKKWTGSPPKEFREQSRSAG